MSIINKIIENNRNDGGMGIFSICSALPEAVESGLLAAKERGCPAVIESTSNQVDQYGGYTGMTPDQFSAWVFKLADELGLKREKILLGGDHLGPNAWKNEPEASAMDKAEVLVRSYVKNGYRKIHLDASMMLADDDKLGQYLPDEIVAERTVRLCAACEDEWKNTGGDPADAPSYIIGTEVPVPGGVDAEDEGLVVTSPAAAAQTIDVARLEFKKNGLDEAWGRVISLVVQPGVEFGDSEIHDYNRKKAKELSSVIGDYPGMVFEAHSTDYQPAGCLRELVKDHFAVLKVGPWLSYAYREALFMLAEIEKELFAGLSDQWSRFREVLWQTMFDNPKYWEKYYLGTKDEIKYKAFFSLSDRVRYYWPYPTIKESIKRLYANLEYKGIPLTLLSQFFPEEYNLVRAGVLDCTPAALVRNRIGKVTGMYADACGFSLGK